MQAVSDRLSAAWPALLAGLAAALLWRCLAPLLAPLRAWLRLARRIAAFPGPRPWPVVGNIPEVGCDYRYMLRRAEAIQHLYAPVAGVWLGPVPAVCVVDPRDVELVLGGYKNAEKGFLYKFIEHWLGSGLITAKMSVWRPHRRLLNPAFHSRVLAQFVPAFSQQTDTFLAGLARHADGPAFDVQPAVELLALDTLLETAMGVHLDVQNNSQHEYVLALKELEKGCIERGTKPWLYPDCLFRLSPLGRRWWRALAVVHGTRDRVVQERKRERTLNQRVRDRTQTTDGEPGPAAVSRRQALLDLLLDTAELNPAELSEAAAADEVDTFMMAGFSTTTHALSVALYLLSQHPEAQERAAAEVESVFGTGRAPDPSAEQLARLPYLDRVIKEALRLYPSVMVLPRKAGCDFRLATREDLVVPEGCMVVVSPYFTQRDPSTFPDPERFDPDRWLPENSTGRHPYSYFPFSAGPRNCIGKRFAQLQILCVLAKLLWRFQLLPEPGFELWPAWAVTTVLVTGSRLRLAERREGMRTAALAEDSTGP